MKTWSTLSIAVGMSVAASFAAGQTSAPKPPEGKPYYYWLHPKLGHVKVDRATNAMLVGKRASADAKRPTQNSR